MHSQALSEAPCNCWLIMEDNGTIVAANCDCKAGLGSACTHSAATVFYLECANKIREKSTVTGVKAYWMLPGGKKDVPAAPVSEIDFSSAASRRRRLMEQVDSLDDPTPKTPR